MGCLVGLGLLPSLVCHFRLSSPWGFFPPLPPCCPLPQLRFQTQVCSPCSEPFQVHHARPPHCCRASPRHASTLPFSWPGPPLTEDQALGVCATQVTACLPRGDAWLRSVWTEGSLQHFPQSREQIGLSGISVHPPCGPLTHPFPVDLRRPAEGLVLGTHGPSPRAQSLTFGPFLAGCPRRRQRACTHTLRHTVPVNAWILCTRVRTDPGRRRPSCPFTICSADTQPLPSAGCYCRGTHSSTCHTLAHLCPLEERG